MTNKKGINRYQGSDTGDYLAKTVILKKILKEVEKIKKTKKLKSGHTLEIEDLSPELQKEIAKIVLPEPVKCAGLEGAICYLKQFDIF